MKLRRYAFGWPAFLHVQQLVNFSDNDVLNILLERKH